MQPRARLSLSILWLSLVAGCSSASNDSVAMAGDGEHRGSSTDTSGSSESRGGSDIVASPGAPGATPPGVSGSGTRNGTIQPGTLTAGAWDDNRNFDRFLKYRDGLAAQQLAGLLPITNDELRAAHTAAFDSAHATLDVSLVIDTTG